MPLPYDTGGDLASAPSTFYGFDVAVGAVRVRYVPVGEQLGTSPYGVFTCPVSLFDTGDRT